MFVVVVHVVEFDGDARSICRDGDDATMASMRLPSSRKRENVLRSSTHDVHESRVVVKRHEQQQNDDNDDTTRTVESVDRFQSHSREPETRRKELRE